MSETVPIPASIWQRIQVFLRSGATGSIQLDVHQGKVQSASFNERVRHDEREKALTSHTE